VYSPGEAWAFSEGAWKRVDSTDVGMNGRVMSKEAFGAMFPSLPALSSNAFNSASAAAKASS